MLIRNIWCVGRNFADHAKEMNAEIPTSPMIFLKAGSSATVYSNEIMLPHWVEEVHHEVEIALLLNDSLQPSAFALALDLTERKLQVEAKKNGHPWTRAKSFDGACPMTAWTNFAQLSQLKEMTLRLWVNDQLKQEGSTKDMIFKFDKLVEHIIEFFPVCARDVILTGTPAGVGPIRVGDVVKVSIEGELTHVWRVKQEPAPKVQV